MHDGIRLRGGKRSLDLPSFFQIALNEPGTGMHRSVMACDKIIENGDFVALIEQKLRANASDVAGAANNKNFHWRRQCDVIRLGSKADNSASGVTGAAKTTENCEEDSSGLRFFLFSSRA